MPPKNLIWLSFALALLIGCMGSNEKSGTHTGDAELDTALALNDLSDANGGRGDEIPPVDADLPPGVLTGDDDSKESQLNFSSYSEKITGDAISNAYIFSGGLPNDANLEIPIGKLASKNIKGETTIALVANFDGTPLQITTVSFEEDEDGAEVSLKAAEVYANAKNALKAANIPDEFLQQYLSLGIRLEAYLPGNSGGPGGGGGSTSPGGGSSPQAPDSLSSASGGSLNAKFGDEGPNLVYPCVAAILPLSDTDNFGKEISSTSEVLNSATNSPPLNNGKAVLSLLGYTAIDTTPVCNSTTVVTSDDPAKPGFGLIVQREDGVAGVNDGYGDQDLTEHQIVEQNWVNANAFPKIQALEPSDIDVAHLVSPGVGEQDMLIGDIGDKNSSVLAKNLDQKNNNFARFETELAEPNVAMQVGIPVKSSTKRVYATEVFNERGNNLAVSFLVNQKPLSASPFDCIYGLRVLLATGFTYPHRFVDISTKLKDSNGNDLQTNPICAGLDDKADMANPPAKIAALNYFVNDIKVTDVNNDGRPDLLTGASDPLTENGSDIFINQGGPGFPELWAADATTADSILPGFSSFTDPVLSISVIKTDLATNGGFKKLIAYVYKNPVQPMAAWGQDASGAWTLLSGVIPPGAQPPKNMSIANYNADKSVDVVSLSQSGVEVYVGISSSTSLQCQPPTTPLAPALATSQFDSVLKSVSHKTENLDGSTATDGVCNPFSSTIQDPTGVETNNALYCFNMHGKMPALKPLAIFTSTTEPGHGFVDTSQQVHTQFYAVND